MAIVLHDDNALPRLLLTIPPPPPPPAAPLSLSPARSSRLTLTLPFTPLSPIASPPNSPLPSPSPFTDPDRLPPSVHREASVPSDPIPRPLTPPSVTTPIWKAIPPTPPPVLLSNPPASRPQKCPRPPSVPSVSSRVHPTHPDPRRMSHPASVVPAHHPRPPSAFRKPSSGSAHFRTVTLVDEPLRRVSLADPPVRPLFHLGADSDDEDEDEDEHHDVHHHHRPSPSPQRPDPPSDPRRKLNPNPKRYYALLELLRTEAGYLADLRVLVNIYLAQLTHLHHHPKPTSFLVSSPSTGQLHRPPLIPLSPAKAPASTPDSVEVRSHKRNNSSSSNHGKEKAKPPPAPLFTPEDLETVQRNGVQLLAFHESFVERLKVALNAAHYLTALEGDADDWAAEHALAGGIGSQGWEQAMEQAIVSITTLFTTQASLFAVYQSFCAGHSEALAVVRGVQHRHPDIWDAYERHCAAQVRIQRPRRPSACTVQMKVEPSGAVAPEDAEIDDGNGTPCSKTRRHSMGSGSLRRATPLDSPEIPLPTARSVREIVASEQAEAEQTRRPRLHFMDYLIKPAQRICRYPLLLSALLVHPPPAAPKRKSPNASRVSSVELTGSDVVVASARLAMQHVAAQVDSAEAAHAAHMQSVRIGRRLAPAPQSGLATFVQGLGTCVLSGALDVVYHRSLRGLDAGTIGAKYRGAFLYRGGYLVLVKVHTSKTRYPYEPRWWFDLSGFEFDGEQDQCLLPYSIRLYGPQAEFEMACSCAGEKALWLNALRDATSAAPAWAPGEAPSCFTPNTSPALGPVHTAFENPFEGEGLPTIQSVNELEHPTSPTPPSGPTLPSIVGTLAASQPNTPATAPGAGASSKFLRPPLRSEGTTGKSTDMVSPASKSSLSTFFSASPDSGIIVTRATHIARTEIEHELRDVFSTACIAARETAHKNALKKGGEGLFDANAGSGQVSVISGMGAGAGAGVGVGGAVSIVARNRLRRRESLLVRRRSYVDFLEQDHLNHHHHHPHPHAVETSVVKSPKKVKKRKSLKVATDRVSLGLEDDAVRVLRQEEESEGTLVHSPEALLESPTPLSESQCSSTAGSSSTSPAPDMPMPMQALSPASGAHGHGLLLAADDRYLTVKGAPVQRSRSMVDNFRGFFSQRPPARSWSIAARPRPSLSEDVVVGARRGEDKHQDKDKDKHQDKHQGQDGSKEKGTMRKRIRASLRRRVRSPSDGPADSTLAARIAHAQTVMLDPDAELPRVDVEVDAQAQAEAEAATEAVAVACWCVDGDGDGGGGGEEGAERGMETIRGGPSRRVSTSSTSVASVRARKGERTPSLGVLRTWFSTLSRSSTNVAQEAA